MKTTAPTLTKLPDRISKRGRVNEGRPSGFKPEFCEKVIALGRLGFSRCMTASELGFSTSMLDRWEKEFPEFREATTRARAEAQAFFERLALKNMGDRDFNSKLWEIQVRCRFPETYRDVIRTELTGANGGAIEVAQASPAACVSWLKERGLWNLPN